jgi:energy-coupling factor transporter ATP-binding protein EcfA2
MHGDSMSLLFLLPSLGYGLILFASTGNAMLLWLSLATMAVWVVHAQRKSLDLSLPISFRDQRVWIGERRLSLFPALWGSDVRNLVYSEAFSSKPLQNLNLELVFQSQIGITSSGEAVLQPISGAHPHALLIGPTGSGKTELMKLIAAHYSSEIWAIDFKGGAGFHDFQGVSMLVTDRDQSVLEAMLTTFSERQLQPANPKLLLVVDELGEALREPRVAKLVEQVAAKGRSLNVMLLAANQTLSQIPRTIWVNCQNRFSVSADLVDRSQLGFTGRTPAALAGLYSAELLQGSLQTAFGFAVGIEQEKTASTFVEAVNPLIARVSPRQQSEPFSESAPADQTPWGR